METKFTDGKWVRQGKCVFVLNAEGVNRMYAFIEQGWDDDGRRVSEEEQEANACLVSASSELFYAAHEALEVLIACVKPCDGIDDLKAIMNAKEMLSSALAKATGEQA